MNCKVDKLVLSVINFMDAARSIVSNKAGEEFDIEMFNDIYDGNINSPIEQLLFVALNAVFRTNYVRRLAPFEHLGRTLLEGFYIQPQKQIGKYRADFYVCNTTVEYIQPFKSHTRSVLVECDSQEFHDRTEPERRYEKARDRHFIKAGYNVMHFTGAEIYQDPLAPAIEVVAFLTDELIDNLKTNMENFTN